MADRALQYRRMHNLLLLQKHLTLREGSSPLTLILDSLEQSAKPLVQRYIHNAKNSKIDIIIFVSYETLSPPPGTTHFIKARRKDSALVQDEIATLTKTSHRSLLIIDTLYSLIADPSPKFNLPVFLSSLLANPATNLLAIYHTDIPLPIPSSPYAPNPLSLLRYLATAILTCRSLPQTLARKRAAERSQPEPVFGLAEEKEGVLVGLCRHGSMRHEVPASGTAGGGRGTVIEAEFRRKSGRAAEEWFFIPASRDGKALLLDDYPEYNRHGGGDDAVDVAAGLKSPLVDQANVSTFELGLTDRQRRDREGIVLPYFDAQKGVMGDGGEGGRILYDLGVEDDFDEEEDEI